MQGHEFKEWPFLEDLEWVTRMRRCFGLPAVVPLPLSTSPRRWRYYGVVQTTAINQMVLIGYALGVSVHRLHAFYNAARNRYVSKVTAT